jgi:Icc-related predicted phosphoesterase
VLCLADLHSSVTALGRLDAFLERHAAGLAAMLVAGDVTVPGRESYADDVIATVRSHQLPLLLVHGNNDSPDAVAIFRREGVTIHRQTREVAGTRIAGFGGDGNAPHDVELGPGESPDLELEGAVLLTHLPPRARLAYGPDRPLQAFGDEGARDARVPGAAPFANAPRAQICGHIHQTEGIAYLGSTKVIKLRAAMWNRAALVDLRSLATRFVDLAPVPSVLGKR